MLETVRLLLFPPETEDWLAFKPIATDPRMMRYINGGKPWSEEEIKAFVTRQQGCLEGQGFCMWKLAEKASGELIGSGAAAWNPSQAFGTGLARLLACEASAWNVPSRYCFSMA